MDYKSEGEPVKSGDRECLIWIPQAVASIMLLWALNPGNQYGYYTLLRLVCCVVFAYLTVQAVARKREGWAWALGITAVLYNPVIPVHLDRGIWSVINVITVFVAVASIFALRTKEPSNK